MQLHIHNIAELISCLVAIIYYPYLKGTFMKWFLPFLIFICIGELLLKYQWYVLGRSTVKMNYLIAVIESIFYCYIFYNLSNKILFKRIVSFFVLISVMGYCIAYYSNSSTYIYFFPNIIISGYFLAAIALISIYLKYIDDEELFLIKEPGFWIAFGVSLFFSSVSLSFSL